MKVDDEYLQSICGVFKGISLAYDMFPMQFSPSRQTLLFLQTNIRAENAHHAVLLRCNNSHCCFVLSILQCQNVKTNTSTASGRLVSATETFLFMCSLLPKIKERRPAMVQKDHKRMAPPEESNSDTTIGQALFSTTLFGPTLKNIEKFIPRIHI